MRRLRRSFFPLFYVGLLAFFVITVYVNNSQPGPGRGAGCPGGGGGGGAEKCLLEQNRQTFHHLVVRIAGVKDDAVKDGSDSGEGRGEGRDHFPIFNEDVRSSEDRRDKNSPRESSLGKQQKPAQLSLKTASISKQQQQQPTVLREFPPLYSPVLPNGLNCSKVWQGDVGELSWATVKLNSSTAARRPAGFYGSITKDCEKYRRQNGYILSSSEEEQNFPLAFSVMVYKDAEQVERLLRAVYRPYNAYCIHMDTKTHPEVLHDVRAMIKCLPNVAESSRRVNVVWGKFSVLEPELICMETLWRMRSKWRYLINLTGQEFPLKTNKELVKILTAYDGANDILGEIPKKRNMWRWQRAKKPPPHNISVAKGPVHIAATRGFVDFVLHSEHSQDLLAWTKLTGIPDETFFATVNNMHQFGVPGSYTGNLTSKRRIMLNRFKIWDVSNRTCSGQFVRHICHFGPREVAILAQSRHLVANKFTYDLYPLAYDCVEQWYFDQVRREEESKGVRKVDLRYFKGLEIVKHAYRDKASSWG